MVKKILHLLSKEIRGLHEAAYLLGFCAILAQLLSLVRDRLFAYYFGAGPTLDLYYASFRIPDMIFVTIASMVSISVLVPFFIERVEKDFEEGKRFINNLFSTFCISIVLVSAIVFFLVPYILPIVLPGFKDSIQLPELIELTRILLLSPILLGISNFLASITQMYNRFFIYAVSPLLYNFGIVCGTVFLYPHFGVHGLVYGVLFGALLHMLIQVPFVKEQGLLPSFKFIFDLKPIREVVLISLPRTLTLSSNQIATFFLVAFASLLGVGSISIFNFSLNLQSVPLAIIGVSYSSAVFPLLTRLFSAKKHEEFVERMIVSAQHIIFWSVPITVLFIVLRAQIVRTILGAGQFSWADTRLTAASLALFTVSVVGQGLILLFVRAYYSGGKTWKPFGINLLSSTIIVLVAYSLIRLFEQVPLFQYFIESLFKVSDVSGTVVLMLPLAYSVGVLVNTVLHWLSFNRDFKNFSAPVLATLFQSVSASVIMGYVAYWGLNIFDMIFDIRTLWGIFMQGFCAGIAGIIAGIFILKLLDSRELAEVWKTLHQKIWKVEVLPEEIHTIS
ncbi:murein biosynthesis integral membrane protein MurJ [Patescibacteria group bacterium]|nr:MAG: murein biosynthesis integral membrane protein MurJ [Patescibacteria group bacterium]